MIKSFSKINLSLRVLSKKKNGLHNIETNSFLINIYDEILISKIRNRDDQIIFKGKYKNFIKSKKNTIKETLKHLRENNLIDIEKKFKIVINKKIPVFAGLGGGSSNAYFVADHLIKKKLSRTVLRSLAEKVGSDLELFRFKQVYQKSLTKIVKYTKNFRLYLVLVFPNLKCPTREIYLRVNQFSTRSRSKYINIINKNKLLNLLKYERNDLQEVAIKKFPIIRKIINFIQVQENCHFARMTGSGSACFGVFNTAISAKNALRLFKKKYPKYWCVVTRTI